MSWQTYVDSNLIGSGFISKASILGLDGSTWATSSGFSITADEGKKLAGAFKDPNVLRANGLFAAGEKYLVIKADDRSIYGKKGAGGVAAVKTTQGILVGVYKEGVQPGQATTTVEKLADYLIDNGY